MNKRLLIALAVVLALATSASLVSANAGGLVSYWPFDEGSGSVAHDAVNGIDGTVSGAAWVDGKFGKALSFDGTDDYVNSGAAVDNTVATGVTLEAWIRPAGRQNGGIISNDYTLGNRKGYDFFLWAPHDTYGRLYIDFGNGTACGRTWWAIPDADWYNQWHHVAATWDGSTVKLHVDGSEVGTAALLSGNYSDPTKDTLIGGINYGATLPYCPFNGLIDEVRIWNRALSAEEVAALSVGVGSLEWLPPIALDEWTLNENATLPIKFELYGAGGNLICEDMSPTLRVDGQALDLRFDEGGCYYVANFRPGAAATGLAATVSVSDVEVGVSRAFDVVDAGTPNGRGRRSK